MVQRVLFLASLQDVLVEAMQSQGVDPDAVRDSLALWNSGLPAVTPVERNYFVFFSLFQERLLRAAVPPCPRDSHFKH